MALVVGTEDPTRTDVRELLRTHLAFARDVTPLEGVHALDTSQLLDPAITVYGARSDGELVGMAALRTLDETEVELKSMHVVASARRQGIASALLNHVVSVAVDRGFRHMRLETGAMPAFEPARTFYARAGFRPCPPFGDYVSSPTSVCLSMRLGR